MEIFSSSLFVASPRPRIVGVRPMILADFPCHAGRDRLQLLPTTKTLRTGVGR